MNRRKSEPRLSPHRIAMALGVVLWIMFVVGWVVAFGERYIGRDAMPPEFLARFSGAP